MKPDRSGAQATSGESALVAHFHLVKASKCEGRSPAVAPSGKSPRAASTIATPTPGHHGGGFSSGVSMKKRIYTADLAALLNVSLRTLSRLSSRGLAPEPVGRSHRGGHYWLAGDPALKRFIADQRRPGRAADGVR